MLDNYVKQGKLKMTHKKLMVSLFMMLNIHQIIVSQDTKNVDEQQQEGSVVTDEQIHDILVSLNNEFNQYEHASPQEGYCVTIETSPVLKAKLTPYGGKRSTKLLSGVSAQTTESMKKCRFCKKSHNSVQSFALIKFENDTTYVIKSLSHQLLVIPVEHYDHLFSTPFEMQVTILKNIFTVRQMYLKNVQRPIEFHCGSAAGQTVFHLHGRTGVYIQ